MRPGEMLRAEEPLAAPTVSTPSWARRFLAPPFLEVAVFVVAVVARAWGNPRHYDVFIDEVTYLRLGQGVAEDFSVALYGRPFHLHPPGFWFLEAAWLRATGGVHGTVVEQVVQGRWFGFLLAGLMATAVVLLVTTVTRSRAAAAVAGLIVIIDPLLLKISSRILIEPATLLFVVLGWLVFVRPVAAGRPVRAGRAVLAGALMGVAVLTKDVAALSTAIPLAFVVGSGWPVPRRPAFIAAATATIVYSIYPISTALAGQWSDFIEDKLTGSLRFAGAIQVAGFNVPGAPSFGARLVERLELLGATYVLLGVAAPLTLYVLLRGTPAQRLIAMWATAAFAYAGWSVVFGALEEQLFYFVVVPSAVIVTIAAARWITEHRGRHLPASRGSRTRVAAIVLAAYLVGALLSWHVVHGARDDSYARMADWVEQRFEGQPRVRVGITSDPGDVILRGVDLTRVTSLEQAQRVGADYILVGSQAVQNGTATVDDEIVARLDDPEAIAHEVSGRSAGRLILLKVP